MNNEGFRPASVGAGWLDKKSKTTTTAAANRDLRPLGGRVRFRGGHGRLRRRRRRRRAMTVVPCDRVPNLVDAVVPVVPVGVTTAALSTLVAALRLVVVG